MLALNQALGSVLTDDKGAIGWLLVGVVLGVVLVIYLVIKIIGGIF